jgi:hypothetical protein
MASSAARAALAMRRLAASTKTGNVSGKRLMSGGHSEAEELGAQLCSSGGDARICRARAAC